MKIRTLISWFGSKRALARRIAGELGRHRGYYEPFCGGMSVLLAKEIVASETVNDLHGDLICLALVLQHPQWGPWLYRQLRRVIVHEEVYRCAAGTLATRFSPDWSPLYIDPLRIEEEDARRAYHFFIASWLGRNGLQGTKKVGVSFARRYTLNGGNQGTRFAAAVDSIPAWRRRLREVTILRMDGFKLLERIEDQAGQALYVDPPYLSKGAEYVHDFSAADHERLAELLGRFRKARVVVSYFDDPRLQQLYPGWNKIDVARAASLANQGSRGQKSATAPEVLLVNGEVFQDQADDGLF